MSTVATPAPTPVPPPQEQASTPARHALAWLLLIPALAVVALVAIYPLGKTVYQSFTNQEFLRWDRADEMGRARRTTRDSLARHASSGSSVWETIKFTLITVGFEFVLLE